MGLWGGRFTQQSSDLFKQVNDSLPFDQALVCEDIQGSIVWSQAICKAGVLSENEQQQIESVLRSLLEQAQSGQLRFTDDNGQHLEEDIHSFIEASLIQQLGDIGKKLHTGRSRNDQVATDLRLWCKNQTIALQKDLKNLLNGLLDSAQAYEQVIMPGYTHLQRAQPIRYPHWCLAYVEMFRRDLSRLQDALKRMDQCPLGSGALAGTAYAVDRHEIADSLGFAEPCRNSLDAVSDRDFVLELLFCASNSMMHLSRLAEDMIFFNSGEAAFIQLGDAVTSGSSLMPQKKNPDALELLRGKCGRVFGHLQALLVTMKGLPLAYNKDMQEDKEGVFDSVWQWHCCLSIASEVIASVKVDQTRCEEAAKQGYANATELADYLVEKGVPFRTAHDITGQVVLAAMENQQAIEEMPLQQLQTFSDVISDDVYKVLQLTYLVDKRNAFGGTGSAKVQQALALARSELQDH